MNKQEQGRAHKATAPACHCGAPVRDTRTAGSSYLDGQQQCSASIVEPPSLTLAGRAALRCVRCRIQRPGGFVSLVGDLRGSNTGAKGYTAEQAAAKAAPAAGAAAAAGTSGESAG